MLALEHGEPLDEAVYCEVMFDKTISGEVPEHRDFICHTAIPKLERMGVKVRVLRAEKTYVDLFTGKVTRGPKKGMLRAFPRWSAIGFLFSLSFPPDKRIRAETPLQSRL